MTAAILTTRPGVLADLVPGSVLRDAALVLGGAAVTGVAAQIALHTPLSPVPFTLQSLAVLVVGAAFGPVRAAASMLLYLVAGMVGVPWYAGHTHGWHDNPSFGYIVGFVVAGFVLGRMSELRNDRKILSAIGQFVVGDVILLGVGTVWLGVDLGVSASTAISLGITPFLAAEVVKVAAAGLAMPTAWRFVRR
jgi:biotin transport system substrate-specific component